MTLLDLPFWKMLADSGEGAVRHITVELADHGRSPTAVNKAASRMGLAQLGRGYWKKQGKFPGKG